MQIDPTGAPAETNVVAAAVPAADDTDDALGYEAALPFLVTAPSFDDAADGASAVC